MSDTEDFPLDDLPMPKPGKSRARTATQRLQDASSQPAPPPPDVDQGDAQPPASTDLATETGSEPSAEVTTVAEHQDGRGASQAATQKPGRVRKRASSKRRAATAGGEESDESELGRGEFMAGVPKSLVTALDDDDRSRSNVLRAAFAMHAPDVVEAHPPPEKPRVEGMTPTKPRRATDPEDPFESILFRLRPSEKQLLDEWMAKTPLTRSGFVTELLKRELTQP